MSYFVATGVNVWVVCPHEKINAFLILMPSSVSMAQISLSHSSLLPFCLLFILCLPSSSTSLPTSCFVSPGSASNPLLLPRRIHFSPSPLSSCSGRAYRPKQCWFYPVSWGYRPQPARPVWQCSEYSATLIPSWQRGIRWALHIFCWVRVQHVQCHNYILERFCWVYELNYKGALEKGSPWLQRGEHQASA